MITFCSGKSIGVVPQPVKPSRSKPAAQAQQQFDEAVDHEADPEVHEQSPVELIGSVARGRGQARHQHEEVEQAAGEDRGELFDEAVRHGGSSGV
jgi:hypothetical protein